MLRWRQCYWAGSSWGCRLDVRLTTGIFWILSFFLVVARSCRRLILLLCAGLTWTWLLSCWCWSIWNLSRKYLRIVIVLWTLIIVYLGLISWWMIALILSWLRWCRIVWIISKRSTRPHQYSEYLVLDEMLQKFLNYNVVMWSRFWWKYFW